MNISELKLYMECPMKYALTKECKLDNQTYSTLDEKYIIEIKKMIYFFLEKLRDEKSINIKGMKTEWGKIWTGNRRKKDILIPTEYIGWHRKREIDGLDALIKLKDVFLGMEYYDIVAINTEYMLSLSRGNKIAGTWPLIIVQEDKTRLIDFRMSDPKLNIKNDIGLTAMSMSYRRYFNDVESHVGIYLIDKGKFIWSTRGHDDYKLLMSVYKDIKYNIKNGRNFRLISKDCNKCEYNIYCKEV